MGNKSRIKVGLLGGTFNPIHLGHLRAAEEVREILGLEKIYFIPASIPPHKDPLEVASSSHRLKMLEIAARGNPFFEISDFELKHDGPSYTIDTLKFFSTEFPEFDPYFILGTDLFSEIDTWKEYKKLFAMSNFVLITRPGFSLIRIDSPHTVRLNASSEIGKISPQGDLLSALPVELRDDFRYHKKEEKVIFCTHQSSKTLAFVEIEGIKISSTQIRNLLKKKKSIKYLVPDKVELYILKNKLYTKEVLSDRV
ncbi:MAG TPA: nicotinate-nucleotide adenylyltransferase [Thermodesulfobacteriota bacterium]|nr:nicotinate-nucleotide adenylyltransferase [Thermodesulfobacteriota bacterium]